MPKRISIATHVSVGKSGVESRQFQTIWLLAQGKKTEEVEKVTSYSRTWIYALVKRYNELGVKG